MHIFFWFGLCWDTMHQSSTTCRQPVEHAISWAHSILSETHVEVIYLLHTGTHGMPLEKVAGQALEQLPLSSSS